jgi:putative ABC transport system permease protein
MVHLAIRSLLYKKSRLLITFTGLGFSAFLTLAQTAIYIGGMANATAVIRHADADIWITSKNIRNFDFANVFPAQRIDRVRGLPQIAWARDIILVWGFLKLDDGALEQVEVVGFDPDTGTGGPWAMIRGDLADVKGGRFMILDESAKTRLGSLSVGSIWELNETQVRLVGLSKGVRTFTTAPMVFTSSRLADRFASAPGQPQQTTFIAAKVRNGEPAAEAVATLRQMLPNNDVYTTAGFVWLTVVYWTIQTGMGMALFLTALLGLIVGGAIVGQTVYANTMEHIQEFGTLKAIGATSGDLYRAVYVQAGVSALSGFLLGSILLLAAHPGLDALGVTMYVSPALFGGVLMALIAICCAASYFSIGVIRNLDPVIVFRG